MTTEMWVIAAVRVLGSLPVLRWPFAGAIIAMLVDLSDLFLRQWLDLGGVRGYQEFDKLLDQVYMLTFLAVALRWQPLPRNIAAALYAYRAAGFIAFEATGERGLLLFFPNVFEFWFLFVAGVKDLGLERAAGAAEPAGWSASGGFAYRPGPLVAVLLLLTAAKELQEYALHWGRWLDSFTPNEALAAIWDWLTAPF
ncbi:MAG: hypothetical protein Q7T33_07250 [Dehalococcoidia bacterium]|nr:hypothetical protein [Dehalococcoidia bacterium]